MEKEEFINKKLCIYLDVDIVQNIQHSICTNQRMLDINKVKKNEKINCIGIDCKLAIYNKG